MGKVDEIGRESSIAMTDHRRPSEHLISVRLDLLESGGHLLHLVITRRETGERGNRNVSNRMIRRSREGRIHNDEIELFVGNVHIGVATVTGTAQLFLSRAKQRHGPFHLEQIQGSNCNLPIRILGLCTIRQGDN